MNKRKLEVIYILASRYDEDGYVCRHVKGVIPSNTLCCLKTLTENLAETRELGDDVDISVEIYDDGVQRPPIKKIIRRHRRGNARIVVGFAGVQTNQFARAGDLALQLRAGGVQVMIGGFHVSGVLALFDEPTVDLQRMLDAGVTLVKGEVEGPGVLAGILRDALEGQLKPIYNIAEGPNLASAPVPQPDTAYLKHFCAPSIGTLDTSRGCPFNCSFCTIINVQGRKMRSRCAESILKSIVSNYPKGVTSYFFTDDNLSRSAVWEKLFDGLIALRGQGIAIDFMMQVDTKAYLIPRFMDKAAKAGCYMVFVGMEAVNPKNIEAIGKRQNNVNDYARMVREWHDHGVLVHVGYIIGLPFDTLESVRHDIATLRDKIRVDEASFFMMTPLPGSRDHLEMYRKSIPVDADVNNYDGTHETFDHPLMAPGEWYQAFCEAHDMFYSKENIVDLLLRVPRHAYWRMLTTYLWYRYATLARTHPMATALLRLKDRKSRRPIFPRESILRYGRRRLKDLAWGVKVWAQLFFEFQEIWLLTRKPDDPRWATLAEFRTWWADLRNRFAESSVVGQYEVRKQEARAMLTAASKQLQNLANRCKQPRLYGKLLRQAQEIDQFVRSLDVQMPNMATVHRTEQYIREGLVNRYEELAIRYVAKRRRFNAYRRRQIARLKQGRIVSLDLLQMPVAMAFELALGVRFTYTLLAQIQR